ncbi:MAG: glycosyltransferase [Gammaproteobacteria bacterium]|nr:glycosyltransferase [Gammaproteobacteria bacterium]
MDKLGRNSRRAVALLCVLPGTLEPTRDLNHARQAIVGYYGSWNEKDDPAYVARCALRLLSLDTQLRFEIVGSAPPPEIAALFQAASFASRIKYCGRVPDDQLASTLSRWRLALLPRASCHSTRYSFPNRIVELMANAVPVAVKRNIGAGGLSSSSGILLIDSDAATGANELHRVLVANDLCSELSSSAHAASREHAPSGLVVGQAIKDIVQLAQPTQESS